MLFSKNSIVIFTIIIFLLVNNSLSMAYASESTCLSYPEVNTVDSSASKYALDNLGAVAISFWPGADLQKTPQQLINVLNVKKSVQADCFISREPATRGTIISFYVAGIPVIHEDERFFGIQELRDNHKILESVTNEAKWAAKLKASPNPELTPDLLKHYVALYSQYLNADSQLENKDIDILVEPTNSLIKYYSVNHVTNKKRYLAEAFIDQSNELMVKFFTIEDNVRTLEEIGAKAKISLQRLSGVTLSSAAEVGIFEYDIEKPGAEYEQTDILVNDNKIAAIVYRHSWDNNQSFLSNITVFSNQILKLIGTVEKTTKSRLELEAVERKMFGTNPDGARLLFCEINYGKGSSNCDEYRK